MDAQRAGHVTESEKLAMVFQLCGFRMTNSKRITSVFVGRAITTWILGIS